MEKLVYVIFSYRYGGDTFKSIWETKELAEKEVERIREENLSFYPQKELTFESITQEYLRLKNGYHSEMSLQEYSGFLELEETEILKKVFEEKLENIKGLYGVKEVVLNGK